MRYCTCLIILCFFLSVSLLAQKNLLQETDITGLWKGTLYNDTTKQFFRYEIAISRDKNKFTGYSHTWFIIDDKQYYGVKKVNIKQQNNKLVVEDESLISNNYPEPPAKGVHQLSILNLDITPDSMKLSGPFNTNQTKKYSVLTGYINLQRKTDFWQSSLIPHLEELDLVNNLSFVQDDVVLKANNELARQQGIARNRPQGLNVSRPATIIKNTQPIQPDEVVVTDNISSKKSTEKRKTKNPDIAGEPEKKIKVENAVTGSGEEIVIKRKEKRIETIPAPITVTATPAPFKNLVPAADLMIRKTQVQQTVIFKSDSLQLSLYDNGEVDGDTVSVILNGTVLMPRVGLSTNAVRKTILIDPAADSIEIIMYAENLGSIPPNTGLLVVRDGKDIYEIRFSGDLQRNAAIVFRRKKNP